jgi:ABC-type Fe3+ transport system permease subunit
MLSQYRLTKLKKIQVKRIELIEWGIIVISLILGFNFLTGFLSVIVRVISFGHVQAEALLKLLLVTALYFVTFWLLIRNSRKVARFINGPRHAEETISLVIGKRALLHVILVAVCIIAILSGIATIIYHLFDVIKNKPEGRGLSSLINNFGGMGNRYSFMLAITETIIAAIVLVFSKKIAYNIIRKGDPDELTIDSNVS